MGCGASKKLLISPSYCFFSYYHKFPNGSDHAVIACYLELYEEGEVEHINGVRPSFLENTAVSRKVSRAHATWK